MAGSQYMISSSYAPAADTDSRLETILKNVEIMSPTRFSVGGGEPFDVSQNSMSLRTPGGVNNSVYGSSLTDLLTSVIYFSAYARVYDGGAVNPAITQVQLQRNESFILTLSAANPTKTRWESGWRVFQVGNNGSLHVHKGERATLVSPGQYSFING